MLVVGLLGFASSHLPTCAPVSSWFDLVTMACKYSMRVPPAVYLRACDARTSGEGKWQHLAGVVSRTLIHSHHISLFLFSELASSANHVRDFLHVCMHACVHTPWQRFIEEYIVVALWLCCAPCAATLIEEGRFQHIALPLTFACSCAGIFVCVRRLESRDRDSQHAAR